MLDRVSDGVHEGGEYQTTQSRRRTRTTALEFETRARGRAAWLTAGGASRPHRDERHRCLGGSARRVPRPDAERRGKNGRRETSFLSLSVCGPQHTTLPARLSWFLPHIRDTCETSRTQKRIARKMQPHECRLCYLQLMRHIFTHHYISPIHLYKFRVPQSNGVLLQEVCPHDRLDTRAPPSLQAAAAPLSCSRSRRRRAQRAAAPHPPRGQTSDRRRRRRWHAACAPSSSPRARAVALQP